MASSERTDPSAPTATGAVPTAPAGPGATGPGQGRRDDTSSTGASSSSAATLERHRIRFDCMAEIAYHALMESSLDRWHRIIISVVLISGTASFASLTDVLPDNWQGALLFLIVAAATVDIMFDPPGAARNHRDMRSRFHSLLAMLETCEDVHLKNVRAEMQKIYAQQPPSNRFVQAVAYNVAVDAMYARDKARDHYEPVPRWRLNPLTWLMKVDSAYATSQASSPST
jgi:hypothetical protein